jgi:predicted RNA-binding protein with PUA-like domain
MAKRRAWLIKSEPDAYSYAQLEREGRTEWTGIRNYEARNNLRAMSVGDLCLYYHTGDEKAVVGVASVIGAPKPDSTAKDEDWSSVDVAPVKRMKKAVPLAAMRSTPALAKFALLRRSRLSVVPVTDGELAAILKLGQTKL